MKIRKFIVMGVTIGSLIVGMSLTAFARPTIYTHAKQVKHNSHNGGNYGSHGGHNATHRNHNTVSHHKHG